MRDAVKRILEGEHVNLETLHLEMILEFLETPTPAKYRELNDHLHTIDVTTEVPATMAVAKTLETMRDRMWIGVRVE